MSTTLTQERYATLVERLDPALDAVTAFRRLANLPHSLFLDSSMRHPHLGRYSFVTADPIAWWEVRSGGRGILTEVEKEIAALKGERLLHLPPFQGGIAGMFGYELGADF